MYVSGPIKNLMFGVLFLTIFIDLVECSDPPKKGAYGRGNGNQKVMVIKIEMEMVMEMVIKMVIKMVMVNKAQIKLIKSSKTIKKTMIKGILIKVKEIKEVLYSKSLQQSYYFYHDGHQ